MLDRYPPFSQFFKADEQLVRLAEEGAAKLGAAYRTGVVASGDCFVSSSAKKKEISEKTSALCTEMEGAAIAHVCLLNGVRFAVIRSVSDFADDSAQAANDFEEKAAARASGIAEYIISALK
jgi:adenosylhomocysteine nucleosidase